MCGSCTEKNYNKTEETRERKSVHKVHNSVFLGGKCCFSKYETARYIIIVVYPYGGMQNFGSYQESCVDFFFTSSQQIKLQYGLYTNDDDN